MLEKTQRSEEATKRNEAYADQSIGQALLAIEGRRGTSKKEKERLEALLKVDGVTKASKISNARILAKKK